MQHVPIKWLHRYNLLLVGLDVSILAAYWLSQRLSIAQTSVERWGVVPTVAIIAAVHCSYVLIIYPLFRRRNEWIGHAISQMVFGILLAAIIEASGNTNLVYRLSFVAFVFFLNMVGPYLAIAATALGWILLLMTILALTTPTNASVIFNIIIDSIVTVAMVAGWYFFKRYYVDDRSREAIEASNLLKQEQFKSSVILESITDGVLVIDMSGTIKISNASAAKMFGWPRNEVTGLDYRSLLKPVSETQTAQDTLPAEAITLALHSGKPAQHVSKFETRDDRQVFVDIVASPIYQTSADHQASAEKKLAGIIAVLRDVDEQKREEQQRSDFISTASHEMRTPVASIQGYLELVLNPKITTLGPKAKAYLDKAYEASKHLGQLFQDLLTVSRSEDGRLVNAPQLIDVNQFLEELTEQERVDAEKKSLKLIFDKKSDDRHIEPLLYVYVDPDRLREVILNLLENAVKYTDTGMITVGAALKDQSVIIRVSDTGIGIAPEDIDHIFQKFYRTDNSAIREIGGTGLGLYIVKQIVDMMHGHISVESTIGVGSTFYVELPRISPEDVAKLKPQKPQEV